MPSHTPRGLYQLSLLTILRHSKRWLPADNVVASTERSPFNALPASIAQDLLDAYERVYEVPATNSTPREQARWRLFVTCHIARVKISESTDKPSLRHIATMCQTLRTLEIQNVGSSEKMLSCLKALIRPLRTLTTLDIQLSSLGAPALKLIREECHNLKVLRLCSCCVNDKAVTALKRLPSLEDVDLRDTEVSAAGAARVLKRNPQLLILRHADLLHALPRLASKSVVLQLRELQLSADSASTTIAQSIVATCPKLEQINIELDYRIPNSILNPLYKLQHLSELHVHCICEHVTLSPKISETLFNASIMPILKIRGKQLRALSLECVVGVDLEKIQLFCPHLKSLTLYFNSYVSSSVLPSLPGLKKLQFGSQAGGGDNMTTKILRNLLGKASGLEELSLASSPLYAKKMFEEVFQMNKFTRLRRLELDYCDLPSFALDAFISPSLEELSICGHRAHEQASRALALTRARALPTRLEAYTYSFMRCHKRIVRFKQILDVRA